MTLVALATSLIQKSSIFPYSFGLCFHELNVMQKH